MLGNMNFTPKKQLNIYIIFSVVKDKIIKFSKIVHLT